MEKINEDEYVKSLPEREAPQSKVVNEATIAFEKAMKPKWTKPEITPVGMSVEEFLHRLYNRAHRLAVHKVYNEMMFGPDWRSLRKLDKVMGRSSELMTRAVIRHANTSGG